MIQIGSAEVAPGRSIVLLAADITTVSCDAMVNAANASLSGGGGVDGAIHRVGGPEIMAELCRRFDGCPTGSAVLTTAGKLPCRYVIHAVGPRWRNGRSGEEALLGSAYATAFEIGSEYGCASIVSCSLSTGVYGYPVDLAAPVAIRAAFEALGRPGSAIRTISFALMGTETFHAFARSLKEATETS